MEKKRRKGSLPKGHLTIKVGGEGEVKERILMPVMYLNHPPFAHLLKHAEEEYGFSQKGAITIPCPLEHFRYIQHLIHWQYSLHHHLHLAPCFRVSF